MARKKNWLAKVLLYLVLEVGALSGVAMRPDEIDALLRTMNGTQVVQVAKRELDDE